MRQFVAQSNCHSLTSLDCPFKGFESPFLPSFLPSLHFGCSDEATWQFLLRPSPGGPARFHALGRRHTFISSRARFVPSLALSLFSRPLCSLCQASYCWDFRLQCSLVIPDKCLHSILIKRHLRNCVYGKDYASKWLQHLLLIIARPGPFNWGSWIWLQKLRIS